MFSYFRELLSPTGIDICAEARFTSPTATNLIVARSSCLQIYNVVEDELVDRPPGEAKKGARLELVGDFQLMGTITSMAPVRVPTTAQQAGMDSLLLSFKDAKMSLVEYSRATQSIVSVSMHYYEREELQRDVMVDRGTPEIRVDPQSRCAALRFYSDRFAILPFKQEQTELDESNKHPFHPSFVFHASSIDAKVKNVIDFTFLHDYFEPTLAILYETAQTWTGRLAARRDTRSLVVVSLDLIRKSSPVLFQVDELPYNCDRLFPIPSPVGGLLVACPNALIHVDQTSTPGVVCAVNRFYGMELSLPPPPPAESLGPSVKRDNALYKDAVVTNYRSLGLSLEGCQIVMINPDNLLLILRTGELLLIELIGHDEVGSGWKRRRSGVKLFRVVRLGLRSVTPFCSCRLGGGGGFFSGAVRTGVLSKELGGNSSSIGVPYSPGALSSFYVFIGSRAADSVLLQVSEQDGALKVQIEKASRIEEASIAQHDDDDDDLYGESATAVKVAAVSQDTAALRFRICDWILTTAPIRDMVVGEPAKYSEYEAITDPMRHNLEIVACAGDGAFGSLAVLARSVRAKILTSVHIPDIRDIWSIRAVDGQSSSDDEFHNFLIISKDFGTMVLRTGEELQEIQSPDFFTTGPTVMVGVVSGDSLIVQVHPNGVLVLNPDGKKLKETPIGDDNCWVVSAAIADPFLMLLLNTGNIIVMKMNTSTRNFSIVKQLEDRGISAACLFKDTDNSFPQRQKSSFNRRNGSLPRSPDGEVPSNGVRKRKSDAMDDGDDLYGEEDASGGDQMVADSPPPAVKDTNGLYETGPKYLCFAFHEDGRLEILTMPDMETVYSVPHFDYIPQILQDVSQKGPPSQVKPGVDISEILAVRLGSSEKDSDVYLLARTETGDLFIYKSFILNEDLAAGSGRDPGRLAMRFVKVPHSEITREAKRYAETDLDKLQPLPEPPKKGVFIKRHYFKPFSSVGTVAQGGSFGSGMQYTGVFVTGTKPCWVMVALSGPVMQSLDRIDGVPEPAGVRVDDPPTVRGKRCVRIHPASVDGEAIAFAELHNINIPNGFVSVTSNGQLNLCQLLWQFNYDFSWPVCKVPLKRTPHKLSYHYETETYVLAASTPVPFLLAKAQQASALAAGVIEEGEELEIVKEKAKEDRTGLYFPSVAAFNLELISPVTWETIDKYTLGEYEHVLACEAVLLQSKENTSGRKLFLAVGTGFCRGEDLTTRGRLLLFDIKSVNPEIDNPQTCHKLKLLYTAEEKSPISAFCSLNGYLVCAVGTKIIVYSYEDAESLVGIAFLDVCMYVTSLSAVKSVLLVSDIAKSVWFCGFQEDPPQLRLLGKDYYPLRAFAAEFMLDGPSIGLVVGDDEKNMHIMTYAPNAIQSLGGDKLLRRGDIHAGSCIQKLIRLRCLPVGRGKSGEIMPSKQHFCIGGTLDGGICIAVPLSEKLYKRLYILYSRMVNNLQHIGGLNPRGFRQVQCKNKPPTALVASSPPGPKAAVDGTFLFLFLSLPVDQQRDLARGMGSTVDRIIDDLLEVTRGGAYF